MFRGRGSGSMQTLFDDSQYSPLKPRSLLPIFEDAIFSHPPPTPPLPLPPLAPPAVPSAIDEAAWRATRALVDMGKRHVGPCGVGDQFSVGVTVNEEKLVDWLALNAEFLVRAVHGAYGVLDSTTLLASCTSIFSCIRAIVVTTEPSAAHEGVATLATTLRTWRAGENNAREQQAAARLYVLQEQLPYIVARVMRRLDHVFLMLMRFQPYAFRAGRMLMHHCVENKENVDPLSSQLFPDSGDTYERDQYDEVLLYIPENMRHV